MTMLTLRSAMFEAITFEGYGDVSELRLAAQDASGGGGGGSIDNGGRRESKTKSISRSRSQPSSRRVPSDQWYDEDPGQTMPSQSQSISNENYQEEEEEEEEGDDESYVYPPIDLEEKDSRVTA